MGLSINLPITVPYKHNEKKRDEIDKTLYKCKSARNAFCGIELMDLINKYQMISGEKNLSVAEQFYLLVA